MVVLPQLKDKSWKKSKDPWKASEYPFLYIFSESTALLLIVANAFLLGCTSLFLWVPVFDFCFYAMAVVVHTSLIDW